MSDTDRSDLLERDARELNARFEALRDRAMRTFRTYNDPYDPSWKDKEARWHIYKAMDELAVASYHSRGPDGFEEELMIENLSDCLNHILMATMTFENDAEECQPATGDDR